MMSIGHRQAGAWPPVVEGLFIGITYPPHPLVTHLIITHPLITYRHITTPSVSSQKVVPSILAPFRQHLIRLSRHTHIRITCAGFNDRISHGGWLSGPRTATMPYGTNASSTGAGTGVEGGSSGVGLGSGLGSGLGGLGEGMGSGLGLALPRGTPNPYTLGHPLGTISSSSVGGGYNHFPF